MPSFSFLAKKKHKSCEHPNYIITVVKIIYAVFLDGFIMWVTYVFRKNGGVILKPRDVKVRFLFGKLF